MRARCRAGAHRVAATSEQRWWSRYYVAVRATTLAGFVGFLPYLFFEVLEVDLAYFGVVLGIFGVAAFVAARYAMVVACRIGRKRVAIASLVVSVAAVALFGAVEHLGVALVATALLGFSSGGVRPIALSGLRRDEESAEDRTRRIVQMERAYGLANATILVAGGLLLVRTDFRTLMLALAAAYAAAVVVLLRRPPRTPERRE